MNFISDGDSSENGNEQIINEGVVGKKYIALKPYTKAVVGTSKVFKEMHVRTPKNR